MTVEVVLFDAGILEPLVVEGAPTLRGAAVAARFQTLAEGLPLPDRRATP